MSAQTSTQIRRLNAVVAAIRDHNLGFTDACNYVDDMDRMAREQAEFERVSDERQKEEDEANEAAEMQMKGWA